ncbi:Monooxygenase [Macleaya cordata]|uniref:Monooxygenase n=1 Tax=Macleaya cordata TaxID=56857 RepID=A0A200RDT0_MACCD|nr:Monooxygenase [Macleaya cordata]
METLQGLCLSKLNQIYRELPETLSKIFSSRKNAKLKCTLNLEEEKNKKKKLRILIAGGGVGGLVLALAAKNRGFEVKVFEKDLSAIKGEGQHRGPIQLQSNALAVLEAIDKDVARQIVEAGCITGDRINGLADGVSGQWFTTFDLLTPAVERGLPVTQVICRMTLQDILVKAVGFDIVHNRSKVVDFIDDPDKVTVVLEDGRKYEGDILVGADGIWSKVRSKLFGFQEAKYTEYTCYSGLADFMPPYIDTVGYRVFLGLNQYFVASDVGDGKMQWYGFMCLNSAAKKKKLLEMFGSWCSEVINLISETPEHMILRRDVYDRDMLYSWSRGRVTLLGDSAHPMQPNLGQGGCMAVEDCYRLILELEEAINNSSDSPTSEDIAASLKSYERKRMIRVSIVHAMIRMASRMATSHRPYLDFGSGRLSFLTALRITHPAIHSAKMFCRLGMPPLMTWILVNHG